MQTSCPLKPLAQTNDMREIPVTHQGPGERYQVRQRLPGERESQRWDGKRKENSTITLQTGIRTLKHRYPTVLKASGSVVKSKNTWPEFHYCSDPKPSKHEATNELNKTEAARKPKLSSTRELIDPIQPLERNFFGRKYYLTSTIIFLRIHYMIKHYKMHKDQENVFPSQKKQTQARLRWWNYQTDFKIRFIKITKDIKNKRYNEKGGHHA